MIPERLLSATLRDGRILPHLLTEAAHPWLSTLLEGRERFAKRRQGDLEDFLRTVPPGAPPFSYRLAVHVLLSLGQSQVRAAVPPPRARAALFTAAAHDAAEREEVCAAIAEELGITATELEASLFADLPPERQVQALTPPLTPADLALRINSALLQGLIYRSTMLRLSLEGNARRVVQAARVQGLLCTARTASDSIALEISGPFALFRRTMVYGRALVGLLPHLGWCRRYALEATCQLRGQPGVLRLQTGAPLTPAPAPERFDSKLEAQFARDFERLTDAWELVREPAAVQAGDALVFPDFALVHRADPQRRHLLEIVGFWTAEYLREKLERYQRARLPNLLLCIDADRNCAEADLPAGARVLRFRRRIDAAAVLALIEAR